MGTHGTEWQSVAPLPELGQMVCGTCRTLVSYPRGAPRVRCVSCKTINLVLEDHQIGNVNCANCEVLLMYPYGAPKVKCSCCHSVTDVAEHNQRPRLSDQQGPPPHAEV
ncbi:hypothetical protein MKX03_028257 [Papaver bracteatum]|nr:hypothetical protein MKX03_028257 [Papaver bracteatum]